MLVKVGQLCGSEGNYIGSDQPSIWTYNFVVIFRLYDD